MNAVSSAATLPQLCRRAFAAIPHFGNLEASDHIALAPLLFAREFAAGSTLFYEDDDSDSVYFLLSGAVEVFKSNPQGRKMPLVMLRDGGLLGEIGLLLGQARTATARTLDHVSVLQLDRFTFEEAIARGDVAALRLSLSFARILAQRLALTNEKMFELFQNDTELAHQTSLLDMHNRLLTRWTS